MIVSIDPGLTGAIAFIDASGAHVEDMPTMGDGKHRIVDAANLSAMIEVRTPEIAYVERVSAMPGQGVSSMFKFGRSVGVIEGVLGALEIPVVYVTPQSWKKHAGLIGTAKDAARMAAIQRFPRLAEDLKRKKDGGRADALLIGLYGQYQGALASKKQIA